MPRKVRDEEGLIGENSEIVCRKEVKHFVKQISFDFFSLILVLETNSYNARIFLAWIQSESSRAITVSSAKTLDFKK